MGLIGTRISVIRMYCGGKYTLTLKHFVTVNLREH